VNRALRVSCAAIAVVALELGGCTLALKRNADQCQANAECQALGAEYVCSADRVCVKFATDERDTGVRNLECTSNADCAATSGLALCREGQCRPLTAPAASCVWIGGNTSPSDGADVLAIGILVPPSELGSNPDPLVRGAVGAAINELNRARDALSLSDLPPLVGVACDETNDQAVSYLLSELHVPLIIGPTDASRVEGVLRQTGVQAVLLAPFADGPNLEPSELDAPAFLVGCKPNRSGVRVYLLDAIAEASAELGRLGAPGLETISPLLAVSNDQPSYSFAQGINARALSKAGVRVVNYTAGGTDLLSELRSELPPPNLIVASSAEDDWDTNIPAIDSATFQAHQFYPYYLLADKRAAVFTQTVLHDQITVGFPRQYQRLLGLDYHRSAQSASAYQDFSTAFQAETSGAPQPGLEYAYDCTYAAVYAMVAAQKRWLRATADITPELFVTALKALSGGGRALPVGELTIQSVVSDLAVNAGADASLDLIGAAGGLDFQGGGPGGLTGGDKSRQYFHPASPDGELYCIDLAAHAKDFCDTGIVFPASGGPPNSTESQCACFGSP
jgi:hypothetical protein